MIGPSVKHVLDYLFLCCVCIFNGPNFRKMAANGNAGFGGNFGPWGAGGPWVAGAQVGVVPNVAYPIDR